MKAKKTVKQAVKQERYTTALGEYNGRPVLSITDTQAPNPKFGTFSFGLSKARMVLASLDAIREFVEEHSNGNGNGH